MTGDENDRLERIEFNDLLDQQRELLLMDMRAQWQLPHRRMKKVAQPLGLSIGEFRHDVPRCVRGHPWNQPRFSSQLRVKRRFVRLFFWILVHTTAPISLVLLT